MAQADLTAIAFFAPIVAFLLVFIVTYLILFKLKILGESSWLNLFISFLVSILFVSSAGAIDFIKTITPWFAVLIISLLFILLVTGFVGKDMDFIAKPVGIIFVIFLGVVFIVSAYLIFSHLIIGYLPGPWFGTGTDPAATQALSWLYSPRVAGAILLVIIAALASWVLVKK